MSVKVIFRPLIIVLMCFFAISCSDSGTRTNTNTNVNSDISSDEVPALVEIKQTRLHAGSEMQMDYRIDGEIKVNQPVMILLSFQLEPYQLIELEIQSSDRFDWLQNLEASYQADESGVITVEMNITPVVAGKAYIKMIAATIDGSSVRAFAIPLVVFDVDNTLPVKLHKKVDRINLPSTTR